MARILLDTTVLIDALRGRPAAQRLVSLRRSGVEPWACAISVEEVWRGLLPGEEWRARRLFNGLRTVPLGVGEGIRAGLWRREFAARGIRCLSISPAIVDTPFHDTTPKSVLDSYAAMTPMGRAAEAEEIAETILFACSDAAPYMTADTIYVSGGMR